MLRWVLKEILENAAASEFEKDIYVSATVEDVEIVKKAQVAVMKYFTQGSSTNGLLILTGRLFLIVFYFLF